ncbi:hypothetical protein DMI62_19905 [Escherichia coli]|nr:hypothetical protein [Escherichia coli]
MDWRGKLLLGILCGLVNGFVIAKLKINALITTLATMQIVRGLAYIISDGSGFGIEDESFASVTPTVRFVAPIWLTVACLIIFGLLLNKTTFGRNTCDWRERRGCASGGTGCSHQKLLSLFSGLVSAIAGYSGFTYDQWAQPMTSIGYELIVIPPAF